MAYKRRHPWLLRPLPGLLCLPAPVLAMPADGAADPVEIVVTAQKRPESAQKAPLTIEVLDTRTLSEHNVHSFQDYATLVPCLTYDTSGPGQAEIYFRGLTNGNNLAAGSLPTVGLYLDEQPVTTIGQALDVHMVDIARIEALPGPQGTLYGASSEAGTLRIITNKPDPKHFSAAVDGTVQSVAHGDTGGIIEGFVNIPLSDHMAVRIVGFDEADPGYINNVASFDQVYQPSGVPRDNRAIARNAINHTHIAGGRALLKAEFDGWTIEPGVMVQHLQTDGASTYRASLGYLQNTRFFNESYRDDWVQAALTITGHLGPLDLTYAGAFLDRETQYVTDYSDYSYYYDQYYTQAALASGSTNLGANFVNNAGDVIANPQLQIGHQHYRKLSNEVRLALPKHDGLQFVLGAFTMHQTDHWKNLYEIAGLADDLSVTGYPGVNYANIQQRTDQDNALFGQASYDITPQLTLTGGLRAFWFDNALLGFFGYGANNAIGAVYGEATCSPASIGHTPGDGQPCNNVNGRSKGSGLRHKLNLAWQVDRDRLVYLTWSTGYRPGGVNRDPVAGDYLAEKLSNFEAGIKTRWFDRRVTFNADMFYERLSNAQFGLTSNQDGIEVIVNSGRAHAQGFEADLAFTPFAGLSLTGSIAHVVARIDSNLCQYSDPTYQCTGSIADYPNLQNSLTAPSGTRFALNPSLKGAATVRYEFATSDGLAHVQAVVHAQSGFVNSIATNESAVFGASPAYASVDLAMGFARKGWSVELVAANAFDSHADIYRAASCNVNICGADAVQVVPIQPRLVSLRLGYHF